MNNLNGERQPAPRLINNIYSKRHSADVIFVLCLFLVFSITFLNVLFLGAKVYSSITQKSNDNYAERTTLLYVSNKIRAYGGTDNVAVEDFAGKSAIVLSESIDGVEYVTRIYEYDGYLMELFTEKDNMLEPVAGTRIMEVSDFQPEQRSDTLIKLSSKTHTGSSSSLYVSLN